MTARVTDERLAELIDRMPSTFAWQKEVAAALRELEGRREQEKARFAMLTKKEQKP